MKSLLMGTCLPMPTQNRGHATRAGCHAFAAKPSGLPRFLPTSRENMRPTERAYILPEDGDRRGSFWTVQTRDLTSPSFPSGGNLPFPHAAATCDVSSYEHQAHARTLCARALPHSLGRSPDRALPQSVPINAQHCPTQGRSGRPSPNGVFPTAHSWQAVTVTKRRFSDRALTASGHRHQTAFFGICPARIERLRSAPLIV